MNHCQNCSADCGHCGGCGSALTLNAGELMLLKKLGQIPFLPVARRADDPTPIYLGDDDLSAEEYSLILQCLEKKGLIQIDFDAPLKGFDGYGDHAVRGSAGLSARGQKVLEILEIQGFSN